MGLEEKKMPFNLFRKKKQPEQEKPAVPPQETQQEAPVQTQETPQEPVVPVKEPAIVTEETPQDSAAPIQEQPQETVVAPAEQNQEIAQLPEEQKPPAPETVTSKTYLKAMPLRELSDLENIKTEVKNGNIIILRVTPLASKSIENVKTAVNDLYQFAESIEGDIARLGEERVVICPKTIRIWREKSPTPVSSEPLPTSA